MESIQHQLVAKLACFVLEAFREIYRDAGAQRPRSPLFDYEPALQSLIVVAAARRYDLRPVDVKGLRFELPLLVINVRSTGKPRTFPLFKILTISAFSSLKRKSASSKMSVPLKAFSVWKLGDTVDVPLAKKTAIAK